MAPFFIALFKINIVLALFALAYYGILRRLTFYTANRFFLLFGIVFATLYPLIDLSDLFLRPTSVMAVVPEFTTQLKTMVTPVISPGVVSLLSLIFFSGLTFMLFRLLRQFVSLYRIHRYSEQAYIGEHPVRLINDKVSPFSFGKHIYINGAIHNTEELMNIVAHEHIHVRQIHSLDVLLAEFSLTFYWFNPAAWILRKAIKENLEYIADHRILADGVDKKTYQYSLLQVGIFSPSPAIANDFNLVDLKNRIVMMNKQRSSRSMLFRYTLLLPLLVVILAFTISPEKPMLIFESVLKSVAPETTLTGTTNPGNLTFSKGSHQTFSTNAHTSQRTKNVTSQSDNALQEVTVQPKSRELVGQPLRTDLQTNLYETAATEKAVQGYSGKPAFISKTVTGVRLPNTTTTGTVTKDEPGAAIKKVPGVHLDDNTIVVTGYPTRKPTHVIQASAPKDSSGKPEEVIVTGFRRP